MEISFQTNDDSRSIIDFFKPSKSKIMKEKKESKQGERLKRRKNSTQMSLSSWLIKKRPKQDCDL